MLFRGLLQPWLGLTATSVLFGLLHVIPRREMIPWTIFSVAAGFLLGWLFAFSGTLVAPIACHISHVPLEVLDRGFDALAVRP